MRAAPQRDTDRLRSAIGQPVSGLEYSPRERARWPYRAGISLFLAAIIWVVFGQTLGHPFVNYDDQHYVYENAAVKRGLSLKGVGWAFTQIHGNNWHPLTTLSHMLDCELYGLKPGGHHLSNLLFHAASAILLFLVLVRMAGAIGRSAFVAAVFAVHPLRVESVAWVAERKDVLSGAFFMLTLGAYAVYVKESKVPGFRSRLWYWLGVGLFGFALMCKPTVVTLPLVLLLLDYWPLGRVGGAGVGRGRLLVAARLVAEKVPFLCLSAASCVATVLAQQETMGLPVSLAKRAGNALVSYAVYLRQMFYPADLAVFYPHPLGRLPWLEVLPAFLLLAVISIAVWLWRRRQPWLLVGWLWYLGMLVPMIGIVQVGAQAHADRYTYLPQIGLYVLVTWFAAGMCARLRHCRLMLSGLGIIVLAALMQCARVQTSYWRDSQALWKCTLECTRDNCIAEGNMGLVLLEAGQVKEAIAHFNRALEIEPRFAETYNNLGVAWLRKGRRADAIACFQRSLKIRPRRAEVHGSLGDALYLEGRRSEAILEFQKVLELEPGNVRAHFNLGLALAQEGRIGEAVNHYRKALKGDPAAIPTLNNLAWILATCPEASWRNGAEAVRHAEQASRLAGGENAGLLDTLAAAYAEAGRFSEAVATARRGLALASERGNPALAAGLRERLALYEAGRPYRKPP